VSIPISLPEMEIDRGSSIISVIWNARVLRCFATFVSQYAKPRQGGESSGSKSNTNATVLQ